MIGLMGVEKEDPGQRGLRFEFGFGFQKWTSEEFYRIWQPKVGPLA